MRVGVYFDLRNPPRWRRDPVELFERTLRWCERAEELDIDRVWLSEHHLFDDGYLPQPLTLAAAIAARTQRIGIGTAVLLLPLHHPMEIAEQAAVVDLLSAGRLELGVGVGYRETEFAAFDQSLSARYEEFERRVLELRRLWAGVVQPPPLRGGIPLWGGFGGPRGARLAGRLGMGLLALEPRLAAPYAEGLREVGLSPHAGRFAGVHHAVLTEDPETTWPRVREHFAHQWDSYRQHAATPERTPRRVDVDAERAKGTRVAVLTPEQAADAVLARTTGIAAEEVFFWASIAGMPDGLVEEQIRLIGERLRPLLAEAGAETAPVTNCR